MSEMRKLRRAKAKREMKRAGFTQLFKRSKDIKGQAVGRSKFAEHWREYAGRTKA